MLFLILPGLLAAWGVAELVSEVRGDNDSPTGTDFDTQTGDASDDTLIGNNGPDLLDGLAGNDLLQGQDGGDLILGGDGTDILLGNEGEDEVRGGTGRDFLIGGDGSDSLYGEEGDDWVEGGASNEILAGGLGSDTLLGGTGADLLSGGANEDLLFGGTLDGTPLSTSQLEQLRDGTGLADVLGALDTDSVTLIDDDTADTLRGNVGSDTIILGSGDTGEGGTQQDSFIVYSDIDADIGGAVIADLDASETIALLVTDGTTPTITVQDDGADATILSDGTEVARVTGQAGQISASDIAIVRSLTVGDIDPNNGQTTGGAQEPVVQTPTTGDDDLTGTDAVQDFIDGDDGNDILRGEGGNDRLRGDAGLDILRGGSGSDVLNGGQGRDALQGDGGADRMNGGSENDWLNGGAGNDTLGGGSQEDVLIGGSGADLLEGGNRGDLIIAGDALDAQLSEADLITLRDNAGTDLSDLTGYAVGALDDGDADTVLAGDGNDTVLLGNGDSATGGSGSDTFLALGGAAELGGGVITDYDAAQDTVVVVTTDASAANVVTVTAQGDDALVFLDGVEYARVTGAATTLTAGDITVQNPLTLNDISAFADFTDDTNAQTLTTGDDSFTGTNDTSDQITALAGDDTVQGLGGSDRLNGDTGADILIGGLDNDSLFGGVGADLIQGNDGEDLAFGGSEPDWINGGTDADTLNGNAANDTLIGGDGADSLRGNNNDDSLVGGDLYDRELTTAELNTVRTGGTVTGLSAGALDDGASDVLNGGPGNDILVGAAGDIMIGEAGEDVFAAYASGASEGATVSDYSSIEDDLVVIYDNGAAAPTVTVTNDGVIYTVLADGNPVMIIGSTTATITPTDIQLVERNADGSVTIQ